MTEQSYLLPPEEQSQVVTALRYLAGMCDGAIEEDGIGFNKIDSYYGKQMALLGDKMTYGQTIAANKMIQKYRNQLAGAGLELPDNGALERALKANKPQTTDQITLNNQRVMVYFKTVPDEGIRNAMKRIPNWRWERELQGKPWSFPAREAPGVIALFPDTHIISKEVIDFAQDVKEALNTIDDTLQKYRDQQENCVRFEAHEGKILVHFPGFGKPPDDELDKVRTLPARRWAKELPGSPWEVPPLYYVDLAERFPNAYISQSVRDLMDDQLALAELGKSDNSDYRVEGLNNEHGTPRPYQWAAMEFIEKRNGRALIADDQGLGKCLETYGYIQAHPEIRPIVIVCPSSVKTVWKREFKKWMKTGDIVELLESQTPYETYGSILVLNYDILHYWADHIRLEIKPALVIADEAHFLKNVGSLRAKAAFKVILGKERKKKTDRWSYTSKPVKHFLPLTGTPITNKPMELWTALHLLDQDVWKNRHRFGIEFGMAYQDYFGWKYDAPPDTERLHQAIAPYVLRRRKQDVLKELPDKMHIPLPLEIDRASKIEYIQAVQEVARKINELKARGLPVGAQHLGLIEKLKQITARGKLNTLTDWIRDTIENEKLLVFCTHTEIIEHLVITFGDQAVEISGRIPVGPKRDANIDAFMNDPTVKLCAANILAGGVGLTLTAASKALFAEFPWNPKELDQAADRIHRIGQSEQVMIYYACAADTIDESIVEILVRKGKTIDKIMDGEASDYLSVIHEVVSQFMKEVEQLELDLS